MSLLIDGYNVLHTVGLLGGGVGPGTLRRARGALLGVLAASLGAEESGRTTVVFDAHDVPRDVPEALNHRGISVRFAVGYPDADTLIEELIRRESVPKRLTVVSSDRRIRRAAERRGAISVDSETWYDQLLAHRRQAGQGPGESQDELPAARSAAPSADEVDYWLSQFGDEQGPDGPAEAKPAPEEKTPAGKPSPGDAGDLDNPFPPGYGEDLLADNADDLWDASRPDDEPPENGVDQQRPHDH